MGRRALGYFVVAALGLALAAGPSLAKKCSKCGPKVHACKVNVRDAIPCTGLKGKDRKTCVHGRIEVSRQVCGKKACLNASPCSPSGAFVD
jgi:hypothetical protein